MKLSHGILVILAAAGVLGIIGVVRGEPTHAQDYPVPGGAFTTVVTYNPTVALTAVTTPQIAANTRRIYLRCTNDSGNVIYLSLGSAPALNSGVRLNITGGNTLELSERLGNLWTGTVSAITGTTGSAVLCTEGSQ